MMLEDYSMLIPEGNEEQFDLAVELLSETDWAMPLLPLAANTKDLFYSYFGQVPKASTIAAVKTSEFQIKT
jgi:hypothetical protein